MAAQIMLAATPNLVHTLPACCAPCVRFQSRFLWFEAAAGTVVAKIAANDQLVVMYRPAPAA